MAGANLETSIKIVVTNIIVDFFLSHVLATSQSPIPSE